MRVDCRTPPPWDPSISRVMTLAFMLTRLTVPAKVKDTFTGAISIRMAGGSMRMVVMVA